MKLQLESLLPEDSNTDGGLSVSDIVAEFGKSDKENDKGPSKEPEPDTTEIELNADDPDGGEEEEREASSEGETEETDEESPETEDDLEDLITPFPKKKILKEFPELFKKFPEIERAVNTSQKYREVFPTVNDALEAQASLERYQEIESDLGTGSSKGFLGALKEKDSKSFASVVDNYLGNLKEVDEGAYFHVVGNNVKSLIVAMAREANRMQGNETSKQQGNDLLTAAKILNEFTFGTSEFAPPGKFGKEESSEEQTLKKERDDFERSRLETHQNDLTSKIETQIGKKIEEFIDPKDQMSAYVKKNAIRETNEKVASLMSKDKELRSVLDKLWLKAKKDGYSAESLGNIRRAYVSKANSYLPQAIKIVRQQALSEVSGKRPERDRKGPLERGRSINTSSKRVTSPKEIPANMSTLDFLNRNN